MVAIIALLIGTAIGYVIPKELNKIALAIVVAVASYEYILYRLKDLK